MFSFFKTPIHIQISSERITMKNLRTGLTVIEPPELAINLANKPTIVAVGSHARPSLASGHAEKLVNPFAHPRSLVSDFTLASELIMRLMQQVLGGATFRSMPTVVVHPLGHPEGGFTQVEIRALHEMAMSAGASEVQVWTGRPLTDDEVFSRSFPHSAGMLH